jgi:glucose-1-phosphate thymidylyltransferase
MSDPIGLVPAAGRATRLGPQPCSKEVFPIGVAVEQGRSRPKAVCEYLLERFAAAGAREAVVVLRHGKWDIPQHLASVSTGLDLAYVVAGDTPGPPYTIDRAYPFVRGRTVLFGFPDIVFEPVEAYRPLVERLGARGVDAVLGGFPAHRPEALDMIDVDPCGRVRSLVIQPRTTDLRLTWICAVWSASFTELLHRHVAALPQTETSIGHVVRAALDAGLRIEAVAFEHGRYLDIGTPEDLRRAGRWLGEPG